MTGNAPLFVSTRGKAPPVRFEDVLLNGLAPDGGLYMPREWPRLSPQAVTAMAGRAYADIAAQVLTPFLSPWLSAGEIGAVIEASLSDFDHKAITPLSQIAADEWLLELFHGPTLAFKDIALQLLSRLIERAWAGRDGRLAILGATSGDTGAAAIEAVKGRAGLEIFILHPKDRISEVQRRQMTTVTEANVHNLAIEGTFDDCQAIVKGLLGDQSLRARLAMTGVNSINWARIMAQTVYYFVATAALGRPCRFVVPTGNFGNVFAGIGAGAMGLEIDGLVIATNENDILNRMVHSGTYEAAEVRATPSPAMDIQVASNFERMLFEASGRNGAAVADFMATFASTRKAVLAEDAYGAIAGRLAAGRADEGETLAAICAVWEETGRLIDPHTAVAVSVARRLESDSAAPTVILSTAHAAKFPDTVEQATGVCPPVPRRLQGLDAKPERFEILPADSSAVQKYLEGNVQ